MVAGRCILFSFLIVIQLVTGDGQELKRTAVFVESPENLTRDGSNSPNSLLGHFCHDRLSLAPFSSTLNFIIRRIHLRHAIRLLSLP